MPDKVLSDYIESKRSRGAFTEPEADRFLMPKEAPPVPVSVAKAPPSPNLSSIQARTLINKAKNSGLSTKQAEQVLSVAEAGGPVMATALDRVLPANPNSGLVADNMSPADFWSSAANGIANTFVSFNAGVRQIGATATGTTQKEIDAIRDWQRQNEVQLTASTKRMLAQDDLNMTKFGFGVGNAVGSVAISLAAAVPLVATGVGVGAAGFVGAAASYPMIFNSTFNSAIDAGYSPEDAAKYAHLISVPISAMEMFPVGKLARTLGAQQVADIATSSLNKYLPKAFRGQTVDAIADKIAKDGLSESVLTDVYLSTKNGIRDRLLINGGKTLENAAAESYTEIAQNYMQKFGEVIADDVTDRNQGKGGFGTTMQDVFSKKQLRSALEDGMYGAIAGGGASLAAIGKPLYEQGVYNTLAKFDQKGKLDEGVDRLMSSLQAKIDAGQIDGPTGAQAMQSIQQVATSYRKLGSAITDPKIKMAMFSGVRMKDQLTADMQALQAQKAEVERKIQAGEIDPDIAKFEDRRIDSIIEQKNKQYAFTSQWLTETSSEIFSNRINSIQAQEANVDQEIDRIQSESQQAVDSQSKWKSIMGYTPNFASVRLNDLNAGLKAIQDEYNTKEGVYAQEALKDKDLMSDFDVFEEATKTVVDNGKPSVGKFVSDGMGNYAVVVEQTTEGGGKRTMYRPVPKTEYYEERLGQIFDANKRFDGVAQKMVEGKELTADEAKLAKDFDVDIANVFADKKAKSDDRIAKSVEKIVFSEDPTSIDMSTDMPDFEKQVALSMISDIKVVTPALAKAVKKGDKKSIDKIVNKKANAKISGILEKLSLDQEALSKLVEKKPKEPKSKKKATQSESSPQEVAVRQAAAEAQVAEGPEAADAALNQPTDDTRTTSPEQSAVAAEATPAETEEQAGQDSESALGLANQEADNIINAIIGDGGPTSGERTVQWTISGATLGKLEASIAEINRLTAEATGQKPSNAGGLTEQDIQSGEKSVAGSDADQTFKEGENVRNFANTLRKVFNVDIEVLSDTEWENAGLPITANGIFIGTKGKIYVRDMPGAEGVLIHELGHVAVRVIEKSAPMLALQAYKLVKGTKYEALVRKEYPNLKKEADILREALGWAIQEKGEQLRSAEDPTLYEKFIQMMKRMFKRIAERLGFDAPIDIDSMTLEQFSNEIASKILEGAPFEKAFNIYMQEFQPDPSFGDELSLFGGHVTAASQKPQMVTDSSGKYITPTEVASFKTYLSDLQNGNPFAQDATSIEDIIKDVITPMIGNSRNFTDIEAGDLDSKEAKKLYEQLASGKGVTSKKSAKLLKDIKDSVKKYNKWVLSSHAKVIDNSSGRPVESYAYINSDAESAAAHANVSQLKAANKGLWGKVNQFFLNSYFSELFGIETVAQFLGGDTGIIGGIHGMIRKRNNDAATFAKYADSDINRYKDKLQQVMGLRDINEFFQRKVTVSAFNNMDGNPTEIDLDIPIGAAADIVVNYRTQYLNAKGGPDRTHSSIYYDPTDNAKGATVYANGIQNYRGITQTVEDNEYNLLFTDEQLQQLEDLFAPGSEYEFIVNDAFDFYSGNAGQKSRFEMVNEVYRAVKGEDLKAIPQGTYAPTRAYMDGVNRSHREMGAAYDDVSFIKPREDLPPRLQGNKDVLSAMESYNRRAQNFIRNAEAAESLLVYTKRVKDKWNDKEMQSKLDWLDQYRKDLNSYEQDRISAGEKEGLGVSLKTYRAIMSNFSKSVFAFNFANPLKQSVGYMGAYGLGIIDNKYLRKYQPFVLNDTRRAYTGYIADDEGKLFGQIDGGTMFFNEQQDQLLEEISEYDEMSDIYIRLNDATANTQGVPMPDIVSAYSSGARGQAIKQFLGEKYDSFTRYGLAPMRRSDRSPILGFYQAAKDQVRDVADAGQLFDDAGNPASFEDATGRMTPAAARMVADKVTEVTYRTNNMYMTNDKTGLQRSHGILAETIGLFTSQPQKVFNLFLQNMFKAARSNFTNERDVKMLQSSFGYAIIMSAVTTASITVAYSIFKNGGLDDDDEPLRDFVVEFAKNVVGIAPSLFTEVLISALSIFDSRGAVDAGGQNPVFEQITKVLVGINSYRESFDAKTPETELRLEKKAANEISSGLAAMTGVPSSFVRLVRSEFFDTTQQK